MKVSRLAIAVINRLFQKKENKDGMCTCAYMVQPNREKVWCKKCRAYQKHSRFGE